MKSKYNNIKTIYNGIKYDSKKEAEYAKILDLRIKANDIISYQRQVKLSIVVNGVKICNYIADFVVQNNDNLETVIDVKGYKTSIYKLKKKLVEAIYDLKITEI